MTFNSPGGYLSKAENYPARYLMHASNWTKKVGRSWEGCVDTRAADALGMTRTSMDESHPSARLIVRLNASLWTFISEVNMGPTYVPAPASFRNQAQSPVSRWPLLLHWIGTGYPIGSDTIPVATLPTGLFRHSKPSLWKP